MTEKVVKQVLAIRASGETNMFDVPTVKRIACRDGYTELAEFLCANVPAYVRFILTGETDTQDFP